MEFILKLLNNTKVFFWLLEESCLDCIRYQHLKLKPQTLNIGVRSSKERERMANYLVDYYRFTYKQGIITNGNIRVIIKIENQSNTKVMSLQETIVNVPCPVVRYLRILYGTDWRNYNGIK